MNSKFITLFVAVLVVAGLMVFQATKTSSATVIVASDLMAKDPKEIVRRIRVGGRVADLPIDYATEPTLRLSLRIMDPGKSEPSTIENTIAVVYEGLRPDMFAAGRDVIIDGHFEGGILYAATLLTQCPSKYEPPDAPKSE